MAQNSTRTILKVYLLTKSSPDKEEGVINLCDESGELTQTQVHFESLDEIPAKVRELLHAGDAAWSYQTRHSKPAQESKTLEQLLEGVNDNNLHHEHDMGPPVGQEVW
jgi:hypothetical protein